MRNLTSNYGRHDFQICLQRENSLEVCGCLRMEAQGVVFKSPRRLEPMADLVIRIERLAAECMCRKMVMEGIVVGCEQSADGCFEVTVLFLQKDEFNFAESVARGELPTVNPMLN
ncbi:MAG: hypothetical protein ABI318_21820 [Chthoniobacteraceae bacterium]